MKVKRDVQMMTGRFVAGMMAIVFTLLIILNPIDAEAAARGYGTGSGTITVTTKADWRYPGSESITFKNAKIVFEYSEWGLFRGWRTKTRKDYPEWEITFKSTDGKHKGTTKMKGGSLKLNLKRNKTYTITVMYAEFNWAKKGSPVGQPYWYVSGTHKATWR